MIDTVVIRNETVIPDPIPLLPEHQRKAVALERFILRVQCVDWELRSWKKLDYEDSAFSPPSGIKARYEAVRKNVAALYEEICSLLRAADSIGLPETTLDAEATLWAAGDDLNALRGTLI